MGFEPRDASIMVTQLGCGPLLEVSNFAGHFGDPVAYLLDFIG